MIGMKINPVKDLVAVDGERLSVPKKQNYRYIMLNKPRGYLTSVSDDRGRKCVMDLLHGVEERVYRLDAWI